MSKKDAKSVFSPCSTTSLNVVQIYIHIFFALVDLMFILSEKRSIFFQMVLWYSLMGDRNNWWLSLSSNFLLFTLDIFFLNSDPTSYININKTKTKTDAKNEAKQNRP